MLRLEEKVTLPSSEEKGGRRLEYTIRAGGNRKRGKNPSIMSFVGVSRSFFASPLALPGYCYLGSEQLHSQTLRLRLGE